MQRIVRPGRTSAASQGKAGDRRRGGGNYTDEARPWSNYSLYLVELRMLYYILGAVAVVVVLLVIVIATRPGTYQVTRTGKVSAPPAAAFAEVNDFHRWSAWSPWEKLDPNLQRTFEGPSSGKGAIYRWQGNKQVGAGNMTITESRPGELVQIRLEFIKPFAALCDTQFAFKPEGNQTAVVWTMNGTNNFMAKAMCMFMNMDKMIGTDFEKGLAQLKAVVEGNAK